MNDWELKKVPFKYQLSDWTLFKVSLPLQCRSAANVTEPVSESTLIPTDEEICEGSKGYVVRALPIVDRLPEITRHSGYLVYIPLQYEHCYIDLNLGFDRYQEKFSSKSRSTIKRKIKKFEEQCGGKVDWRVYKNANEVREFFRLAAEVSKRSYQERVLDAGLPTSEDFIEKAVSKAELNELRAYILFDGERPVSYLYCPAQDGNLFYAYLGYDPEYMKSSVGTVLQWLAIESLFEEKKFEKFDFTEGQSEHKRYFSTHQVLRANVFILRCGISEWVTVYSHSWFNRLSAALGDGLKRLGLKGKVKKWLRFQ